MSDPALPPPGWYADPAGTSGSRWWDGDAWTGHVRTQAPADDPPPLPDGIGTGRQDRGSTLPLAFSGRSRLTALVMFGGLVVGLVATAAVGLRTTGSTADLARDDDQPSGQVLPGTDVPAPMSRDEVEARGRAAGCELVADGEPLEDRSHVPSEAAPPPDALYPDRPAHSGRHYGTLLPRPSGVATVPIDERAVLHNMEHGSVVVWVDVDAVDRDAQASVAEWWRQRVDLGFTSDVGGAVFVSPMPEVDDPPAVALRAWGVAMDCHRFDAMVADGFLADHWGSHGRAPEGDLSPYPEESLAFRERA